MSVYDLVMERRTLRKYRQKPVPEDLLDRLIDAGRMAPAAANLQPLEFIAVNDPEICAQIFPHTAWAGYLEEGAPRAGEEPMAYLVILRNQEIKSPVPDQDLGFAAESIILTAWAEGIASCAIGALKRPPLKEVLSVPETYVVELVIALGYPAETAVAYESEDDPVHYWRDEQGVHHVPKRPKRQVAHWNRFGGGLAGGT